MDSLMEVEGVKFEDPIKKNQIFTTMDEEDEQESTLEKRRSPTNIDIEDYPSLDAMHSQDGFDKPSLLDTCTIEPTVHLPDDSSESEKVVDEERDWTSTFTTKDKFQSKEELVGWVRITGKQHKMFINVRRSDFSQGRAPRVYMVCERHGTYKPKKSKDNSQVLHGSRRTGTKKIGCPFQIKGMMSNNVWTAEVLCGRHNHPLATYVEGHSYTGRLNRCEHKVFKDLSKSGVRPKIALAVLKDRDPSNSSLLQTLYNEKKKYKKEEQEDRTPMQQLMKLTAENRYVIADRRERDTDVVTNRFWAHPESISLIKCFPYVLIMDSTYKTNLFDYPLFEVVGVTSTMKTFVVCYCAMLGENTENFTWVLQRLKELIDVAPLTIVTDRDLALMKACGIEFPNNTHLLCRWHINMAVHAKIQAFLPKEDVEDDKSIGDLSLKNKRPREKLGKEEHKEPGLKSICKSVWQNVVYSETIQEFDSRWFEMCTMFAGFPELLKYIQTTWLIYKEKFVATWTDRTLHFGNTSSNRVESAHAMLKNSLNNSHRQTFLSMWNLIHQSWICNISSIKTSFESSLSFVTHEHRIKKFDYLRGNVSKAALQLMKKEFEKCDNVASDGSNCMCILRRAYGLPCAHEMKCVIEKREGKMLLASDIHPFWKKLSAIPRRQGTDDLEVHEEFAIFLNYYHNSPPERKAFLLRRLKDLGRPHTTTLKEPKVIVKSKGRPKKKKLDAWSTKRDPSAFECTDDEGPDGENC